MMENENKSLTEATAEVQNLVEETAQEAVEVQNPVEEPKQYPVYKTTQDVVERITELAQMEQDPERQEVDLLKSLFYKFRNAENEAKKQAFIEAGGNAEEYQPEQDENEEKFKAELSVIRERRQKAFLELEQLKADNLMKKLDILDKIKAMTTTPEETGAHYQEFKMLQEEWKTINPVPAEKATELWKNFQLYCEQFYDLLQLNREAREYDFKKNLEIKTLIIETAEKLSEEEDVISAFYQLQTLHNQWRESGPVAKELREDIWTRFKAASTIINKRYQDHYLAIKEKEEQNLELKTALCEKAEAMTAAEVLPTNSSAWDDQTKIMLELQAEWKTIGFTAQKMNAKIFERFRAACDSFFTKKNEFYTQLKESYSQNIDKKKALVEKAKELADSTEWRATSDKLVNLQKEWKAVGPTPHKVGEELWTEFISACNKFFEARNAANAGQRNEQQENLQKKYDVVARIKGLIEEPVDNMRDVLKSLSEEFSKIGHVPFKDKDTLYTEYKQALDAAYSKLNKTNVGKRLDRFKKSIKETAENLGDERSRLARRLDNLKKELATVENNLSFFSVSNSKKANPLLDGVKKQMEKIKDEISLTVAKIKAIDEKSEN